jgi:di/tricarboxylate transporter
VITNSVMRENGLPVNEEVIFLASLVFNLAIAVVLFLALGGRELMGRRIGTDELDIEPSPPASGGGVATAPPVVKSGRKMLTDQVITLVAFVAVALVALVFERNIGFTAITAAVILTALFPKEQKGAIKQVAWPTVLLVAGVSTFAAVLSEAGAPEAVGTWAAGLGTILIGALVLCYVGGVTSAFASSTALLPIIVPIAIPLIASGGVGAVAVVAALAVSSTIVDVSPFSTNGAIMVANRPDSIGEEAFYQQVLRYSVLVVVLGPLLVWGALVVPGGLG